MKQYFCPNFSLAETKQDFDQLSNIVGEDYAYYLWNQNKGLPLTLTEKNGKEVPNETYNNLLNAFNGNVSNTTYAFILQNSSAFKKLNKDYNKLTPLEQAKAIHQYVNSLDKGVEELGKSVIKNLPKGFNAEFYQSGGVSKDRIVIDRKTIREKVDKVNSQTESAEELQQSQEKITDRQSLESFVFAKTNVVARRVDIVNMQRTVKEGRFAQWTKDAITLYQGSDFTDIYHESWHEFTQRYLSKAERIALYSLVKSRPGSFKVNGVSVPYYALTNRQTEEILAEEFRTYVLDRQGNEKQKDLDMLGSKETEKSVKNVFQRIYDFFTSFFSTPVNQLNKENPLADPTVMDLFVKLYEGRIKEYVPSTSNITEKSIDRSSKRLTLSYDQDGERLDQEISALEMSEIFDAMDYWLTEEIENKNLNFSFLLNSDLKEKYLPQIYESIKNRFSIYADTIANELEEAENNGDDALASILENRDSTISWILANSSLGDNWKKVVKIHQEQSKGGVLKTNNPEDSSLQINQDRDQKEDIDYDETEAVRNQENWDDVSVNPEQLASPTILELLAKLPNLDEKGNMIYSDQLGLPTLSDYTANKNLLFKRLSGIQSYTEVINVLKGLVEYAPQFQFLIDQLPDPNKDVLTPDELSLKAQFMQSFTMSTVDPYSVKLVEKESTKESGVRMQTTTFLKNTLTTDSLLEYFDQDFKENQARKYRLKRSEDETASFDIQNAFDDIVSRGKGGISTDREYLEFYRDMFGVDLIRNNEERMFDNKGNYKKNSVPYINDLTLQNLRSLAAHSFNKLRLIYMISVESQQPNYPKISVALRNSVSSMIESPFTYFATDISRQLIFEIKKLDDKHPIKEFFNKAFKQTTTYNERKYVFDSISFIYNTMESASYLNGENNLEWSIRDRNHILSIKERINAAKSIDDLPANLHPDNSAFFKYSLWMKKLWTENGNKSKSQDGQDTQIGLLNFADLTVGRLDGQKTTSLTSDDKYIQDLVSFLVDGVFENLRFGSKSSSFASVIGNNKKERIYYEFSEFNELEEGDTVPSVVISQFIQYLRFELVRIHKNKAQSTNKEKLGSRLFIFKDILNDKLIKTLEDLAKNSESEAQLLKDFNSFYNKKPVNRVAINNSIKDFFKKEVDIHKQDLADILTEGDTVKLNNVLPRLLNKTNDYTTKEVNDIFSYYLANYMTHQIEFTNIMVADVSNYQIKPKDLANNNFREVFKRLGLSSSPGKEPLIDEQDLRSRNTNEQQSRKLEALFGNGAREYTKQYRIAVANDIKSFDPTNTGSEESKAVKQILREEYIKNYAEYLVSADGKKKVTTAYLKKAEEEIGESVDAFLNQDEESNAQAYANLDFVRFYLDSIGEWLPELEAAYQHEVKVAEAIIDYRKNSTPENRAIVERLRESANQGIFTSLKLGHYGEVASKFDEIFNGKYSVFPLAPSAVFDTDNEKRMIDMYQKGVDFVTFKSGAKMALPVGLFDYYKESENGEGFEINEIPEDKIFELSMQGLRRQQYIAPKFKNKATLSTQLVKLLFSNFFINGSFDPVLGKIKGLKNKIEESQKQFITNLELLVNNEKNKIYVAIGAELDEQGELKSVNYDKFEKWLKSEFDKKDISPALYEFVKSGSDGFRFALDASPQRSVLEGIISSVVSKRILRPSLNGESYIQLASTGFNKINSRYRKLDKKSYKETVRKYGLTGLLQDYRIEDGVTKPADVAVSFNSSKHSGLLNLEFEQQKIETVERLNEILLGDTDAKRKWLDENHKKLVIVGVRIPVQGFNSMEYFKIKMFLPEVSGPVIVVPPSIITKSGSDFDIDKLFMYEPTLDSNGQIISSDIDLSDAGKNLQFLKLRKDSLNFVKETKELLAPYKRIANNLTAVDKVFKKEYLELLNDLEEKSENLNDLKYFDDFDKEIVQLTLKIQMLDEKIKRIYGEAYYNNKALKPYIESLNQATTILNQYRDYGNGKIKAIATNNLIDVFESVLSEPALYKFLTKPNDSLILRGISAKYLALRSMKNRVTSTSMFLPRISRAIYEENTLGKKALGIDAKTNALHKLFQQVGLRFTDENLNDLYLIKSNKYKGQIVLGGLKDADLTNYISDIINEFINGHVDIEKEDWINYFNADTKRTSVILQMVLNGTPIEDAIILVNQPIIQHYTIKTRRSKIKTGLKIDVSSTEDYYKAILKPLGMSVVYKGGGFSEIDTIKRILVNSISKETIESFNSGRNENLSQDKFKPEVDITPNTFNSIIEKLTDTSEAVKAQARKDIGAQLALFTQYRMAFLQNQVLLNLTQAIDFNTSKYRTISDFYNVDFAVKEARDYFNADAIEKILGNSVVSPFNTAKETIDIYKQMFELIANPEIQETVTNFLEEYGKYWNSEKKAVEIANFLNGLTLAIIQNKHHGGEVNFTTEFGPLSDYLTKGYNPDKSLDLMLAKLKSINDPVVKRFLQTNTFFNNLSYSEIPDSGIGRTPLDGSVEKKKYNKMYFKVRTPDKDPDTVGSIMKAWLDAYSFSQSTPENNAMIREFAFNLANATIYGQGYSIKYRSLQPFIPLDLLRIDGALKYFKDLRLSFQQNNENEISEFKEDILIPFIKEYTIKYDRFRRKNYTPFKRYFPYYITKEKREVNRTINISASSRGFSAQLTNPTELAVYRKNLSEGKPLTRYEKKYRSILFFIGGKMVSRSTKENSALYPVEYAGKLYADVEAAYQDNKKPYLIAKTTQNLMLDLLKLKFSTYPELVVGIYSRGGTEYLDNTIHRVKGDKFWESDGENQFIETLKKAYESVLPSVDVEQVAQTEPNPEEYGNAPEGDFIDDAEAYEYSSSEEPTLKGLDNEDSSYEEDQANEVGMIRDKKEKFVKDKPSLEPQVSTSVKEFDLADKLTPIEQNFADGSGGRQMQLQFKGKSTMDLIISGDRTRTTRAKTDIQRMAKDYDLAKISDLVGRVIRMTDKTGRQVYTRITKVAPFTQEYQDATWQKEGWVKSVTDKNVGDYPYAIEFEVVKRPTQSSVEQVLKDYSLEALRAMSSNNFKAMGLSPQEISELISKIC